MPRILVVDDEPHLRELVATVLGLEGHAVDLAADGEEALRALEPGGDTHDVVLLDLGMPRMDGWRFLQELYERGIRARTRLVIMSGHDDARFMHADPRSNIRHILTKPFDAETLLEVIDQVLGQPPQVLFQRSDRSNELVSLIREVDEIIAPQMDRR